MEIKQEATNKLDKPEKVNLAIKLLYISIGVALFAGLVQAAQTPDPLIMLTTSTPLITIAIMWFLIYMTGKGKNWARIIFLILVIIGTPFVFPLFLSVSTNPFQSLIGIGQAVIQITSVIFLFQKPSSDWFRKMKVK